MNNPQLDKLISFSIPKTIGSWEKALLLMTWLGMEPYAWQIEFFRRCVKEGWQQPILDWAHVLVEADRLSGGARRSGRTTVLAVLLAVDEDLSDLTWVTDHYPTEVAAKYLISRAIELKEIWENYKKGNR